MKPLTKNNHYIPQFILRNFTDDDNKIYHFSKDLKNWKSKNRDNPNGLSTRKTAQQIHLYTTEQSGMLSDEFEQKFSQIEADVAPIVKKILTIKKKITALSEFLTNDEYGLMMFFLTISLRRTPTYLKYINKHFIAALDTVDTADDFFEETDRKYVKRNKNTVFIHNNFTVPFIFNETAVNELMSVLSSYKWFIFCKSGLPGSFLLGDTLLSFLKLPVNEPINEVYVPLSKNHMLFGYRNNEIHKDSSILMNLDRHSIKKINEYVVANADKFVFCSENSESIKAFILKSMKNNMCSWECVFPFEAVFKNTHRMTEIEK